MKDFLKIGGIIGTGAIVASLVASDPSGAPATTSIVPPVQEQPVSVSKSLVAPEAEKEKVQLLPKPVPIRNESTDDAPKAKAITTTNCHPSYSGCLKQNAGDYDCAGGSGNGPNYTGPVQVHGSDPFDLDRDNDGWGCE